MHPPAQQSSPPSVKRWLFLAAALTSGCALPGKPPLPRFSLGEAPRFAPTEEKWMTRLREVDVIYVSLTTRSAANSQSAWQVVATLQAGGEQVAFGWGEIPTTQQSLLDQWQREEIDAQGLVEQLALHARADWLRQALRPGLPQVALGSPRELLRKLRAGEALSAQERELLPHDYRPPPEGLENFADRVSTSPRLRRYDLARLYRTHLVAEQIIAENILQFRREHPGTKLMAFLPDDAMINPREVAGFAAQKATLRQMMLDRSAAPEESHAPLLACAGRVFLQVVNRPPEAGRHHLRLVAPRLRA
jgi:hypothetical protein